MVCFKLVFDARRLFMKQRGRRLRVMVVRTVFSSFEYPSCWEEQIDWQCVHFRNFHTSKPQASSSACCETSQHIVLSCYSSHA